MRDRKRTIGFAALAMVTVMGILCSVGGAQAQSSDTPAVQKTGGDAVGATVAHPAKWSVERERYTFDESYGYTLWRPATDESHDHGGTPALRVALAYGTEPRGVDNVVSGITADYPDLDVKREVVPVAKEHEGVAVGPIPGSTPATRVYVPVNDRVYRIEVYAERPGEEGLDADDRELLRTLRFESPSRAVRSLDVTAANSPEALYKVGNPELAALERSAPKDTGETTTRQTDAKAGYRERRIEEGCWRANPAFFVQVQHGRYATRDRNDGMPTGHSRAGTPNYWGQYTHGNLGYGRCNEPGWANDKFAVDYRLNAGDFLYSPFKCGRVTFAGRNTTHRDYGRIVVIRSCGGKYVSLSAHLSGLRRGISKGDRVYAGNVIGYAGKSGGGRIPVGPVHLHQAFYRYPKYNPDGSPYGGTGLQVTHLRYSRGDGGIHRFGWERTRRTKAGGSLVVN